MCPAWKLSVSETLDFNDEENHGFCSELAYFEDRREPVEVDATGTDEI